MEAIYIIAITILIFLATGFWWRYHSLACPASLSWLVENPYMNAVAGPSAIFKRIKLKEGMKVLDVGSGPGRLTIPAAKVVGDSGEIVALDIQSGMLKKLAAKIESSNLSNIRLLHAGAGEGKLDKNYFDRALLITVLGEISDKKTALNEIYQALKNGGILSITELIPDPHYTKQKTVQELCLESGFEEQESFGNFLAFTSNFIKPE